MTEETTAPSVGTDTATAPTEPAKPAAPPPRAKPAAPNAAPKVSINLGMMPPAIIEVAATAPCLLVAKVWEAKTQKLDVDGDIARPGVKLRYDADAMRATCDAFRVWLASLNIETSPIGALLLCYAVTIGSAMPDAIEQTRALKQRDIRENREARLAKERAAMQSNGNGANHAADTNDRAGVSSDTAP